MAIRKVEAKDGSVVQGLINVLGNKVFDAKVQLVGSNPKLFTQKKKKNTVYIYIYISKPNKFEDSINFQERLRLKK